MRKQSKDAGPMGIQVATIPLAQDGHHGEGWAEEARVPMVSSEHHLILTMGADCRSQP